MCGIGLVLQSHADAAHMVRRLEALQSVQSHRGPDGSGQLVINTPRGGLLGLAHQRLSILDLTQRASQPMQSACGRYVLSYNGEIYNYRELAAELGLEQSSEGAWGDTAVLLAALVRWGVQALPKLNGMWAFVFVDRVCNTALVCRDRFGVKPLHWALHSDTLFIASEVKGILAMSGQRFGLNLDSVAQHVTQSLANTSHATFFCGIESFPPASYALLNLSQPVGDALDFKRYWWHPYERMDTVAAPSDPDQLRDLLADAVRLRLRSDVPCGLLLSGGLDSSSILALAKQQGIALHILSAISSDAQSNEEYWINQIARHCQIVPTRIKIDDTPQSFLDELQEATWFNDQPLSGLSMIAHRRLMAAAHQAGIVVLLSGQGSDEQLGGYNKFLYFYLRECLQKGEITRAGALLWNCFQRGTVIGEFKLSEAKRYLPRWSSHRQAHIGQRLVSAQIVPTYQQLSYAEREWRDVASLSLPLLLHSEDRMSMSFGREIRLPFLDYRLVELLAGISAAQKFNGGWPKWPLRQAMRDVLPSSIAWRRDKKGFNIPEALWLKTCFKPQLDALFASDMRCYDLGLVQAQAMRNMYAQYCAGDKRVAYKDVLNIVTLESWLQAYGSYLTDH